MNLSPDARQLVEADAMASFAEIRGVEGLAVTWAELPPWVRRLACEAEANPYRFGQIANFGDLLK